MLDYERFSATQDIDAELRYSYMHLQSFGSSAEVVQGRPARRISVCICAAARRSLTGRCWATRCATCWKGRILHIWANSEGRWASPV